MSSKNLKENNVQNKDNLSVGDFLLKKLKSVTYIQQLEVLNKMYADLSRRQANSEFTLNTLEDTYCQLQTKIFDLQNENAKQSEALERFTNLWKLLSGQSKHSENESIDDSEEQSTRIICEVTNKLDNKSLKEPFNLTDAVYAVHRLFKSTDLLDNWIFEQIRKEGKYVLDEIDKLAVLSRTRNKSRKRKKSILKKKIKKHKKHYQELKQIYILLQNELQRYSDERDMRFQLVHIENIFNKVLISHKHIILYLKQQIAEGRFKTQRSKDKVIEIYSDYEHLDQMISTTTRHAKILQKVNFKLTNQRRSCNEFLSLNSIYLSNQLNLQQQWPQQIKQINVKTVQHELSRVYKDCGTMKEKQCAWALLKIIGLSKTAKDINNTLNLCYGFMSYRFLHRFQPIAINIHGANCVIVEK